MNTARASILISTLLILNPIAAPRGLASHQQMATAQGADRQANVSEFDQLRLDGFDALYNLDYKTARERFAQMTRLAPEHPAGYVYLANNLWLETLYRGRRLSTSLYAGESFYVQTAAEDKIDPKLDREFNDLIRQALAATKARLLKNSKDVEALYYQAAALGIRAAYGSSAKRSFTRAIGDANESIQIQRRVIKLDPNYVDAYLS